MELKSYLDMCEMQKLEEEYCQKDTVRKFQLDYNETICMVDKYPEAMQIEGVLRPNNDAIVDEEEQILPAVSQHKNSKRRKSN